MYGYENEDFELNVDDLFRDPLDEVEETNTDETSDTTADYSKQEEMTKGVSNRINEVRRKTVSETEDRIAKEFGYSDYNEMISYKDKELMREAGIYDEETTAMVDKLVEERLKRDPRLKKLEELEEIEKTNFVKSQLNEINQFSDIKYSSVEELPNDVLKIWETTGNLKQAYLAIKGEELLLKNKSSKLNGSTNHLANPGSTASGSKSRPLTEEEKDIYRSILGDFYNEEEISKKTRPI